jgi:hypothetical protein
VLFGELSVRYDGLRQGHRGRRRDEDATAADGPGLQAAVDAERAAGLLAVGPGHALAVEGDPGRVHALHVLKEVGDVVLDPTSVDELSVVFRSVRLMPMLVTADSALPANGEGHYLRARAVLVDQRALPSPVLRLRVFSMASGASRRISTRHHTGLLKV